MDKEECYYDTLFKEISTLDHIKTEENPLVDFKDIFIEGAIIDIGCGQSNVLLEFTDLGKVIYAIDSKEYQLKYLKKRAASIPETNLENWNFINLSFPDEEIPNVKYSIVSLSNFLHFFTIQDSKLIINKIEKNLEIGSLVYVKVHSKKNFYNKAERKNNSGFKHFYCQSEMEELFPKEHFEIVYNVERCLIFDEKDEEFNCKFLTAFYGGIKGQTGDNLKRLIEANKLMDDYYQINCIARKIK